MGDKMTQLRQDLSNMKEFFAAKVPAAQVAGAQTAFLKKLSELTHSHFIGIIYSKLLSIKVLLFIKSA